MDTFICYRCKRKLPLKAKPMKQVDFCQDCKDSDMKQAEQYFRNGRWKQHPRFIDDFANGIVQEK